MLVNKSKFNLSLVLCTCVLLSCGNGDNESRSASRSFSVTFEEVGSLQEIEENEDSFLGRPGQIAVDNFDHIYVLDNSREVILKYDSEGQFLKSMSRSGRGPGEISDARTMFADSVLLVHNYGNQVLNKFSLDGELLASYNLEGVEAETKIIRDKDAYLLFDTPFGANIESATLVQRYDANFMMEGEGEISPSIFFDEYTREQVNITAGAFKSVLMVDDNSFLITINNAYPGKLHKYSRVDKDGAWNLEKTINGKETTKAYDLVSPEEGGEIKTSIEGKLYTYQLLSKSMGLYQLNDGTYVHFIRLAEGNRREYGVELYSPDLEYVGYDSYAIDEDITDDNRLIISNIASKDSKDRFYGVRYDADGSKVAITELCITWDDD